MLKSPDAAAAVRAALRVSPEPDPVLLDVEARVGSPSLPLMLLDALRRPPAGWSVEETLAVSRERLDAPRAEERVVALRNVARLAPGEEAAVRAALREIVRRPRAVGGRESFAFAQALDGLVALGDVEAIPLLVPMLGRPETAPMAGMTLDRLAAAAPLATAQFLNAHPALLAGFPLLRADYFAKGSLRASAGRAEIGRYLRREDVSDAEREKFFASYLQRGTFLVAGIFTGPARPPAEEGDPAAEVAAALARWRGDAAMEPARQAAERALSPVDAENPIPR